MAQRIDVRDIQKRLLDMGTDGVGLYIMEKAVGFIRTKAYTIERNLKQYSEGVVKVGLSMIDIIIPSIKKTPYIGDWLELLGRVGVRDIIKQFVDKQPYVVADDVNTLHCYNFNDINSIVVYIDGTELTDYTVSGTADDFIISLTNALASGEHDVLIADNKVAWFGKVVV